MHRFFVPTEQIEEERIHIFGDDVNHIKNVLRMSPGEEVYISDGQGKEYCCIIEDIRTDEVNLDIKSVQRMESELPVKLVLFQALPKSDKMEWIIQKAIELGASEIVPVRTKRCVVKLDDAKAGKKIKRWQGIAESAAKQSGRGIVPKISQVFDLESALEYAEELQMKLIPYELCEDMKTSGQELAKAVHMDSVGIFIGPEGGFERSEVELTIKHGAIPISLGKRILRTETAGMTVLSVLMFQIESERNI